MSDGPADPSLLLFDLGGVLLENVGWECFNALLSAPMALEAMKTRWLASPAVRAFESGSCSAEKFAAQVVEEYGLAISAQEFLEAFATWPQGLYPGAAELLAQLRSRFRVACLSNSNAIHWDRFGGFSDHFHVPLSSHLLGTVKPDAACFARALQECGVEATDAVFFDDSLTNVDAAREFGLRAFHVNGLAEVRQTLESQGWL
jgi:putative hydrolase of the HAD superfamily